MNFKFRKIAGVLALLLALCGLYTLLPVSTTSALPLVDQHPDTIINNGKNAVVSQQNFSSLPDFTAIVERASPAVVSIMVSGIQNASNQAVPPWMDKNSPFFEFFHQFGFPGNGNDMETPPLEGQGSGFIISSDGNILTNAHVVENADKITVKLSDNHEHDAKVVAIDKPSDVAIIKINGHNLPTLEIGNSDTLKAGEWVLAIGSPFGFEHTVSAGVVSAMSRTLPDSSAVPFIQTDVAVNPGNSGGPLLNLKGEVIGINSQIFTQNGGYMGLSFAIPINYAMNIEQQLVRYGKVTRGRLGVMIQDVDQNLAEAFGMKNPHGALVSQIQDNSPAATAGIHSGDIILSVDGKDISDSADLARLIAGHKPGTQANLLILRNGKKIDLKVVITELKDTTVASNENNGTADMGRLGLVVSDLDDNMKHQLDEDHGVIVQQVGGAAEKAGIRPGDVILAVNSESVKNTEQLDKIIKNAPSDVALLVKRGDNEMFIPVTLG